jgi:hypothetical protein
MLSFASFNPSIWSQFEPVLIKAGIGLIISGLIGVIVLPFRKMKTEWVEMKKGQASIHSELVQQRLNCLNTLQTQGAQQIDLLGKTVAALNGVRLDLAEQTGYLRALTSVPIRRRRIAKK